jgi:DNA-binding beta-propeller fold protein YncE
MSVAYDRSGQLWISDTGNSRVLVFSTGGALIHRLGEEEGPGKVYAPYGIVADPTRDRMYVADWTGRVVQMFTTNGSYIGHLPADDQKLKVFGPNGFSPYDVDVVNGRVVVSSNDGLYFFDSTGHVVARWGGEGRGSPPGSFNFPDSFTIDRETGNIYVADTMNRRVVALDKDGRVLWTSGLPDFAGKIKGFWQLPRSITLEDGKLFVVDTFRFDDKGIGLGHIVVLGTDGTLLSEYGKAGTEEDSFNFPEGMTVNGDGLWALADRENHRVVLFTLTPIPPPEDLELELYRKSFDNTPEGATAAPSPSSSASP